MEPSGPYQMRFELSGRSGPDGAPMWWVHLRPDAEAELDYPVVRYPDRDPEPGSGRPWLVIIELAFALGLAAGFLLGKLT